MHIPESDYYNQNNSFDLGEPLSSLAPDILEIFRNLAPNETIMPPIWDAKSYIPYLENLLTTRAGLGIINPHKATIQLEMTKQGINEDTTRIVDPHHTSLLLGYTLKLLKEGRKEVWWSIADKDDIADPQGDTKYSPPLFKHITMSNIGDKFAQLKEYYDKHPESLVKIFPQDLEHPSLCSLILVNEPAEKRLNFKIRPRKYTTDERGEKEDPIEINIDLNGPTPIIIVDDIEDLKWIQVLINSKELFAGLDKIDLRGSYFLQSEGMAYGNGKTTRIKFLSDNIWGDKFGKTPPDIQCPKYLPIIEQLSTAKIILNSDTVTINKMLQRHTLQYLLNTLKYNGNLENLTDQLHQIEAGEPPSNEFMIRQLAFALAGDLNLPDYAKRLITLYKGLTELKNVHRKEYFKDELKRTKFILYPARPYSAEYPVVHTRAVKKAKMGSKQIKPIEVNLDTHARLNLLTRDERLSIKEIFLLIGAVQSGSLLQDIKDQLDKSIGNLTIKAPTIRKYRKFSTQTSS